MAAQVVCSSAEARALAAMPVDVLRLILKDMGLKERLRLEILDKSHCDALRDPELWHGVDLDAQDCTEDQLLSLLIRLEPRMQRGAAQIKRMAESLSDVTEGFTKHRAAKLLAVEQLKRKTRVSLCREAIFVQLMSLRFFYIAVPESWVHLRYFVETCTLWLDDQLQRIPLAVRSACNFLRNVGNNRSPFVRNGMSSPPKNLEGQSVSGTYPWKPDCLTPFNPWGPTQEPFRASESIETELERVAASIAPHFDGSRASYQRFLEKMSSILEQREKIAAIAGGRVLQTRGATAEVFSHTVILEHLVTHLEEPLLEELGKFLRGAPSARHVVVRNCMLTYSEFRSLSGVLGEGGAGTVTFQDYGPDSSRHDDMAWAILGSAELQASQHLQALELDFPLAPADVDSVTRFLERNTAGARVVIHLRPAFYAQSAAASRQLFAELRKLCASRRGGRVIIVRHQVGARLPSGTDRSRAAERGGTAASPCGGRLEDAFLTPLQQEIRSALRLEEALRAADRVIRGICIADVIFGSVLFLDDVFIGVGPFGFASQLGIPITIRVMIAALAGWPPLRAAIQGERDLMDMGIVVFSVGLFPFVPLEAALRALYLYLGACLAWTVLEWSGRFAAGWLRRMGPRIKARAWASVKRWSVRSQLLSAKKWV